MVKSNRMFLKTIHNITLGHDIECSVAFIHLVSNAILYEDIMAAYHVINKQPLTPKIFIGY